MASATALGGGTRELWRQRRGLRSGRTRGQEQKRSTGTVQCLSLWALRQRSWPARIAFLVAGDPRVRITRFHYPVSRLCLLPNRSPASLACLADDCQGIGYGPEMAELVGVEHGADHLDMSVSDVQRPDVDDLLVSRTQDRAGLPVDLMSLHDATDCGERLGERGEQLGHPFGTEEARAPLWSFAAAIGD